MSMLREGLSKDFYSCLILVNKLQPGFRLAASRYAHADFTKYKAFQSELKPTQL